MGFKVQALVIFAAAAWVAAQPQSDAEQDYATNRDLPQNNQTPVDYPEDAIHQGAQLPTESVQDNPGLDNPMTGDQEQPNVMPDFAVGDASFDNQTLPEDQAMHDAKVPGNFEEAVGDAPVPSEQAMGINLNPEEHETIPDQHFTPETGFESPSGDLHEPNFNLDTSLQNMSDFSIPAGDNVSNFDNFTFHQEDENTTTIASTTSALFTTATVQPPETITQATTTTAMTSAPPPPPSFPTMPEANEELQIEEFPTEPEKEINLTHYELTTEPSIVELVTRRRYRRLRTSTTPATTTQVPVWVERAERKLDQFYPAVYGKRVGMDINTQRDQGVPINLLPKYGRVGF